MLEMGSTKKHLTTSKRIPNYILDDLCCRFIINQPAEYQDNLNHICFNIEQAHWFYFDFYVADRSLNLKGVCFKDFTEYIFQHVPFLHPHANNVKAVLKNYRKYQRSVPTYGAILLDSDLTHVLLVQSYWCNTPWGFPKGKIYENEEPLQCAVREVLEETGFDIGKLINKNDYLEATVNYKFLRLYIVGYIPRDTKFQPLTRHEIKACEWFPLTDLPLDKKDLTPQIRLGVPPKALSMVIPFVQRMRSWVRERDPKYENWRRHDSMGAIEVTAIQNKNRHRTMSEGRQKEIPNYQFRHQIQSKLNEPYYGNNCSVTIDTKLPQVHSAVLDMAHQGKPMGVDNSNSKSIFSLNWDSLIAEATFSCGKIDKTSVESKIMGASETTQKENKILLIGSISPPDKVLKPPQHIATTQEATLKFPQDGTSVSATRQDSTFIPPSIAETSALILIDDSDGTLQASTTNLDVSVAKRVLSRSASNSVASDDVIVTQSQHHNEGVKDILAQFTQQLTDLTLQLKSDQEKRLSNLASKLLNLQESIAEERLKKVNQLATKLMITINIITEIIQECERMNASTEREKKLCTEEKIKLINERDEYSSHANQEANDIHRKYEKCRHIFESKLDKMKKTHEEEMGRLNAVNEMNQAKIKNLEKTLLEKTKVIEELDAICNTLFVQSN